MCVCYIYIFHGKHNRNKKTMGFLHSCCLKPTHWWSTIVSGWWFQPLWKILVSWGDYSQYLVKEKMFQTTNQVCWSSWDYAVIQSRPRDSRDRIRIPSTIERLARCLMRQESVFVFFCLASLEIEDHEGIVGSTSWLPAKLGFAGGVPE